MIEKYNNFYDISPKPIFSYNALPDGNLKLSIEGSSVIISADNLVAALASWLEDGPGKKMLSDDERERIMASFYRA